LIATGGHIALTLGAGIFGLFSMIARLLAHGTRYLVEAIRHVYDIYIILPLQLERLATGARGGLSVREPVQGRARR